MGYIESTPESSPAAAAGGRKRRPASGAVQATASAVAFAAEAEAAVVDLEERRPKGMQPLERALAARLRSAIAQLRECAAQVGRDGLMVAGSMGQERAHPLLKVVADLRREIAEGLKDLTFRATHTEMLDGINRLSRHGGPQMTTEEMAALVIAPILSAEPCSSVEARQARPKRTRTAQPRD